MKNMMLSLLVIFLGFSSCAHLSEREKTVSDLQEEFRWKPDRTLWVSAHRGGPVAGFPENCLSTFEKSAALGRLMIECDVRLSADSVLVFSHDEEMGRTHSVSGVKISDMTYRDLKKVRLKDDNGQLTDAGIPTLDEVLTWAGKKAVLTLDVKQGVPFKMVTDKIRQHRAEGYAMVITYTLADAETVHKLHPGVMISVVLQTVEEWEKFKTTGIPYSLITAFTGVREPSGSLYDSLHANGIYAALGVFSEDKLAGGTGDTVYAGFFKRGADILATDRPEAVMTVIRSLEN